MTININVRENESQGLRFEPLKNGEGEISGIGRCKDADVVIPAKMKRLFSEYRITSIGYGAFEKRNSILSVDVPSTVRSIDAFAFFKCKGLSRVIIPASVTSIGMEAFMGCSALKDIDLPDSVASIGNRAFKCCGLTSVKIPRSVRSIGDGVFCYCTELSEVHIPASVTEIRDNAFEACDKLSDVYFDGTREMWDAISIGKKNEPIKKAKLHVLP